MLFTVNVVANVARLDRPLAAALSAAMVVLLIVSRHEFVAPPDPPTLFQFIRFLPLYVGGRVPVRPRVHLRPARPHLAVPDLRPRASTPSSAVWSACPGPTTSTASSSNAPSAGRCSRPASSGWPSVSRCCSGPIVAKAEQGLDAWDHANRLVHTYGHDTLAYFALRDDKSFFFSSDGEAMIAYTYVGRYALASGDPIGRPESIELVVDEFLAMCRERRLGGGLPGRARIDARPVRRAGAAHLLPRRRGDRALQGLHPQGQEVEEHPPVVAAGRAHLPLRDDDRDRRLTRAHPQAQRPQRQVAGQGPRAGLHHDPQPRRRGAEPGVPAVRRARRARPARRLPAHRARCTAEAPASPSTSCAATRTRPTA